VDYTNFLLINTVVKFLLIIILKIIFIEIFFELSILNIIFFIGLLSYFIGTFLTLIQKKIIRFLSYGSISHMGLILITLNIHNYVTFFSFAYLLFYFLSLFRFVYLIEHLYLNYTKLVYLSDLYLISNNNIKSLLISNILEIGALPPYNLFVIKFLLFIFLIQYNFFYTTLVLVILSLITIYYYTRLIKNLFYDLNIKNFITFFEVPLFNYFLFIEYALVSLIAFIILYR
jgi:NADH:ubiquinone oxidoreductase subunit 2 (subunit N)